MIQQLFSNLTHALDASPAIAISAALAWGILSIILSPCHIASIPLIVGFIDMQGRISIRRAFWISLLFASGVLVSIIAIGFITAGAGKMLGRTGPWANYLVAAVFIFFGMTLADLVSLPWSAPAQVAMKRKGPLASLLLGLIFGIALGPCTFAFMAPILGMTFKLAGANVFYGIALLGAYALGHCGVIVAAGTSTEFVQRLINLNQSSRAPAVFKKVCGIAIIVAGLYMMYIA